MKIGQVMDQCDEPVPGYCQCWQVPKMDVCHDSSCVPGLTFVTFGLFVFSFQSKRFPPSSSTVAYNGSLSWRIISNQFFFQGFYYFLFFIPREKTFFLGTIRFELKDHHDSHWVNVFLLNPTSSLHFQLPLFFESLNHHSSCSYPNLYFCLATFVTLVP